jgi:hypothetical protein
LVYQRFGNRVSERNYAELNVDEEIKGKIGNTSKLIYYGNPSKKLITDKATLENKKLN